VGYGDAVAGGSLTRTHAQELDRADPLAGFRDRFVRESRRAAELDHPDRVREQPVGRDVFDDPCVEQPAGKWRCGAAQECERLQGPAAFRRAANQDAQQIRWQQRDTDVPRQHRGPDTQPGCRQ